MDDTTKAVNPLNSLVTPAPGAPNVPVVPESTQPVNPSIVTSPVTTQPESPVEPINAPVSDEAAALATPTPVIETPTLETLAVGEPVINKAVEDVKPEIPAAPLSVMPTMPTTGSTPTLVIETPEVTTVEPPTEVK